MMCRKVRQAGFTTIEIVFLLIVIGVLAWLTLATRHGIDEKLDNNERQRDVDSLRVALETYYSRHNMYPTLAEVNSSSWRTINMQSLNPEFLRDPESKSHQLITRPTANRYAYAPTAANGRTCDNAKVICTQYTLTATLTGSGTYVKQNLD